jgi:hypothetical protein
VIAAFVIKYVTELKGGAGMIPETQFTCKIKLRTSVRPELTSVVFIEIVYVPVFAVFVEKT